MGLYREQEDERALVTTTATVAMAGTGGLLMDESEVRVSMYVWVGRGRERFVNHHRDGGYGW